MQDEAKYHCESCGEAIVVPVDLSAGASQDYIENCLVQRRFNLLPVEVKHTTEPRVWAEREPD